MIHKPDAWHNDAQQAGVRHLVPNASGVPIVKGHKSGWGDEITVTFGLTPLSNVMVLRCRRYLYLTLLYNAMVLR